MMPIFPMADAGGEQPAMRKLSEFSNTLKEAIDNLLVHCPRFREEIKVAAKQIRLEVKTRCDQWTAGEHHQHIFSLLTQQNSVHNGDQIKRNINDKIDYWLEQFGVKQESARGMACSRFSEMDSPKCEKVDVKNARARLHDMYGGQTLSGGHGDGTSTFTTGDGQPPPPAPGAGAVSVNPTSVSTEGAGITPPPGSSGVARLDMTALTPSSRVASIMVMRHLSARLSPRGIREDKTQIQDKTRQRQQKTRQHTQDRTEDNTKDEDESRQERQNKRQETRLD
jgi:hypothetical protein